MIQPSLFKRNDLKIAELRLPGKGRRAHQETYGLQAVINELSYNVMKVVTPKTINECDIALCSLTSIRDTQMLLLSVKSRPKSKLIVGGQGVYPFWPLTEISHRIMFGRAEDAVDDIVLGSDPLPFAWDHDKISPDGYVIRQARRLVDQEISVGCNGGCRFCQYRATRRMFGERYQNSLKGNAIVEDRWELMQAKTGNNTTALDGWSEETRQRVGKPVDNSQIIDKLNWCLDRINGVMRLKVYMIVGYPWETPESVCRDILTMRRILGKVRPGRSGGRIMMMITTTPFSPEPLTAMENDAANVYVNWREVLLDDELRCVIDRPHINAFILPQIPGPLTLLKRVACNRIADRERLIKVLEAKDLQLALELSKGVWEEGSGYRVSKDLRLEPRDPNYALVSDGQTAGRRTA